MGACREGADIWWMLRHRPKWISKKVFKSQYFWHDSFGKYWSGLIGCRLLGHRNVQNISDTHEKEMYCFNCERRILKK